MKKLKIEAVINEGDTGFTIQRSKDLSIIEILGLLEHIKTEVAKTMENKFKVYEKDGV